MSSSTMTRWTKRTLFLAAFFTLTAIGPTSSALGPVDGEVGVDYWKHDVQGSQGGQSLTESGDDLGIHASLWFFKRWGVSAQEYRSDLSDLFDGKLRRTHAQLNYKFLAPTDNNHLAVGLGWGRFTFPGGSQSDGVRVALMGRVSFLRVMQVYGQIGYMPSLGDAGGATDTKADDQEIGISSTPAPFLSLRLAYRREKFEYKLSGDAVQLKSDGFLLGAGIHW